MNGIVVAPSGSPTPLPGRSAHSSHEPVSNRWRPCRFRRGDPHRPAPQHTMEPNPVVRGKAAIPVGKSRPDPASAAACRSCRWEDASAVEIVGPVVEVGPQILDGHVGVWEVPVTKASVRTQHLHEDRKIEASVVLGCCLKQLGSVEMLRRPRRPSCLMPCFPGRRVGPPRRLNSWLERPLACSRLSAPAPMSVRRGATPAPCSTRSLGAVGLAASG